MKIVKTIAEVRQVIKEWRKEDLTVGFVPTMGYLHEGHESLIKRAVTENDKVVVSIFVNPIQFGVNEDFDAYPRDLQKDADLCEKNNVGLIFNPEVDEMYDESFLSYVDVDKLTEGLCGRSRAGHFRGVCTVVTKLFNIVTPDKAYFGQKDAQQIAVIKKMVQDLNMNLEVIPCPIIREKSGLAKSSRNSYLTEAEKEAAVVLSKALNKGLSLIENGERNATTIFNEINNEIEKEPLAKVEYIEIVNLEALQPVSVIENSILVAGAIRIGKTRLIDNFIFEC